MTARRTTTLQDELLADLRVAAPIPVARPRADAPADETPTVHLRLTPWRWSRPSLDTVRGDRRALQLSAGPLHISLTRGRAAG